jgi:SAM-dependent methyltransferase
MNLPTDINSYWNKRGQTYHRETRLAGDYHRMQETFLTDVLRFGAVPSRSILEIGCGFGRITRVLAQAFPESRITAVDLSPDQLANARRYCDGCTHVDFAQHDLYSGDPFPGTGFDLAVATEVFLHHPNRSVRGFIERIAAQARLIASIDWCEDWRTPVSAHVWIHNYRALYRDAGLDHASFVLPTKVDGKQQRLFIAGASLPEPLQRLEKLLGFYTPDATEPAWESGSQTPRAALPDNWNAAVRTAVTELLTIVPERGSVILVDDGQWPALDSLQNRRVLPFLERENRWWGPPENDQTALRELDRMRHDGAAYFAYAWPSFWWMEHYAQFTQFLRQSFPCVLENERLVVYQLAPN